ncbi:MAG TPA: histidine triad nucleotide-binding protein [Gammaproteobacteria bacterium]|nr:histidine triad nucleotide-binding protein [Gammaproteobacteria bacterium]
MTECIFCGIVSGDIPSDIVYEDEHVVAFRDINPQAPVHVLVIPRRHVDNINALTPGDADMVGRLYLAAREVACREGLAERGYRTVMNCNHDAGQSVFHVHLHLLGGRRLHWPPG